MAFEVQDIEYLDGKFDKVYKKIDSNKDRAEDDLEKHVDKDHRGAVGKTIIVVSAFIVGLGGLMTLVFVLIKGFLK